jgi:hypothetical protein
MRPFVLTVDVEPPDRQVAAGPGDGWTGFAEEDGHDMVHLNLALDPGWIRGILDAALETEPVVVSVLRSGDLAAPLALDHLRTNLEHLTDHAAIDRRELVDPLTAVCRTAAERAASNEVPPR